MMFGWCPPESIKFTPMFPLYSNTTTTVTIMCEGVVVQDQLVYVNLS